MKRRFSLWDFAAFGGGGSTGSGGGSNQSLNAAMGNATPEQRETSYTGGSDFSRSNSGGNSRSNMTPVVTTPVVTTPVVTTPVDNSYLPINPSNPGLGNSSSPTGGNSGYIGSHTSLNAATGNLTPSQRDTIYTGTNLTGGSSTNSSGGTSGTINAATGNLSPTDRATIYTGTGNTPSTSTGGGTSTTTGGGTSTTTPTSTGGPTDLAALKKYYDDQAKAQADANAKAVADAQAQAQKDLADSNAKWQAYYDSQRQAADEAAAAQAKAQAEAQAQAQARAEQDARDAQARQLALDAQTRANSMTSLGQPSLVTSLLNAGATPGMMNYNTGSAYGGFTPNYAAIGSGTVAPTIGDAERVGTVPGSIAPTVNANPTGLGTFVDNGNPLVNPQSKGGWGYTDPVQAAMRTQGDTGRNLSNLNTLNPGFENKVANVLNSAEDAGLKPYIQSTARTYVPEQTPGGATPAKDSYHMYGLATDIGLSGNNPAYSTLGKIAEGEGLGWGGKFNGNYDPEHIQAGPTNVNASTYASQIGLDKVSLSGLPFAPSGSIKDGDTYKDLSKALSDTYKSQTPVDMGPSSNVDSGSGIKEVTSTGDSTGLDRFGGTPTTTPTWEYSVDPVKNYLDTINKDLPDDQKYTPEDVKSRMVDYGDGRGPVPDYYVKNLTDIPGDIIKGIVDTFTGKGTGTTADMEANKSPFDRSNSGGNAKDNTGIATLPKSDTTKTDTTKTDTTKTDTTKTDTGTTKTGDTTNPTPSVISSVKPPPSVLAKSNYEDFKINRTPANVGVKSYSKYFNLPR